MARTTPVRKAWRALTWLLVVTGLLTAVLALGTIRSDATWAPKLALDLQGGTQIVLEPQLATGQTVTSDQLDQAVSIIRQRIDASGVSESEVSTQGAQNVVVSIPGIPDQQTLDRIESSAKLEFRPVILTDAAATSAVGDEAADASASAAADPAASASPDPAATPAPTPSVSPTDASDLANVTPALQAQYDSFDCATVDTLGLNVAPADQPIVTCDDTDSVKFVLGPVEVSGERISDATAGLTTDTRGNATNIWGVQIDFDAEGTEQFAAVTTRLAPLVGAQNQFAIVLDGRVISAPTTNVVITGGNPEISGSFTQESAQALADQLKFGALPIGFEVQSRDTVSATLGTTQLRSGIIAGLIGLALVIVYSLFQYRLLGLVTVASLVVAAVLTYLLIALLSWRQGFRLSLAGVAGLIVAIGFTADSFIVYFERIRDELRDGRVLESAVEAGWKRALRTIWAAKGVNLLSAVVLFVLAIGNVRGFALTLGLTTVIDVLVVVLFTHPVLQLAARTRFFSSGHRLSGLDPKALGAVYRGRGQFRSPGVEAVGRGRSVGADAGRPTIAERKAGALTTTIDPITADPARPGRDDVGPVDSATTRVQPLGGAAGTSGTVAAAGPENSRPESADAEPADGHRGSVPYTERRGVRTPSTGTGGSSGSRRPDSGSSKGRRS